MARKKRQAKPVRRSPNDLAQLKVRLPEHLRRELMYAAQRANRSMNVEIVERLSRTFLELDTAKIIAKTLVETLDDEILSEIRSIFKQQDYDDYLANDAYDGENEK
jgi:hypothetical protein